MVTYHQTVPSEITAMMTGANARVNAASNFHHFRFTPSTPLRNAFAGDTTAASNAGSIKRE